MGYDWEKLYEGPRSEKRAKRRKINRILNTLIGVVVILIIIFGGKLLFGSGNSTETAAPQVSNNTDVAAVDEKEDKKETDQSTDASEESTEPDEDNEKTEETATNNEQVEPESNEEATVTDGDPESNIIRTIQNPAWKPIGTKQIEPQTNVYDKGTENRNEIEIAASYATGLDIANLTVWWLTNNGPDKAKVTIASKDGSQNYKVYMEWVSGEGWKPVLVEELKENDSPIFQQSNALEEEAENEDESDDE